MTFLIVFACTVVAVFLMKPAIKKAPAAWYVAATVLMALYVSGLQGWLPLPVPVRSTLFLLLQTICSRPDGPAHAGPAGR